eukprot:Opistho-2@67340
MAHRRVLEQSFAACLHSATLKTSKKSLCEYKDTFKSPVPTQIFNDLIEHCIERDGPEFMKIGLDLLAVMTECGVHPDDKTHELSESIISYVPFEERISATVAEDSVSTKAIEKKSRARDRVETPASQM